MLIQNYIGGDKWWFSDKIYNKLTGIEVQSNYNPKISVYIKEFPNLLSNKNVFGLFWSTPTFKDADSNYLFHLYDKKKLIL